MFVSPLNYFFFSFQIGSMVGGDYPGDWVCANVCGMDRCVCVQECPFDLLGWVFLLHVGMYRFVLHGWHRTCIGVLSFG